MGDEDYLCSVGFLNKCLMRFEKRAEREAIACVKRGMRPEKLMNKEQDEHKEEPQSNRKNKGGKGGKRARAAQESNAEQTKKQNNLESVQTKVCPFDINQIIEILTADSASGLLTPAIDELLLEQVAHFLLSSIRKQFWQIL